MSEVDCARFEAELASILADSGGAEPTRLVPLLAHAASCPACRRASDLLRIAGRPAVLRDPVVPPEGTWDRLDREIAAGIARERRRTRSLRLASLAAAAAVATVALLFGLRGAGEPTPESVEAAAADSQATGSGTADPEALALASDRWDELTFLPDAEETGAAPDSRDEGMFPEVDDLDPDTRARLLRWLREEGARLSAGGPA